MPLFRGAGSKMILACLPSAKQKRVFMKCRERDRALASTQWEDIRSELRKIRRAGHAISIGELEPTNVGIAAPIFHDADAPAASLILVMTRTRYATSNQKLIAAIAMRAAERITTRAEQRGNLELIDFGTAS